MDARLNFSTNPVARRVTPHLVAASKAVHDSTLPAEIQELVRIRASQINGCAFCIDMHTKDAAEAGESSTRLNLVATWREATVFTESERAALELCEQATRIADAAGGTPGTCARCRSSRRGRLWRDLSSVRRYQRR